MLVWKAIQERWRAEVDGAGLALVRMLTALCVLVEMLGIALSGGIEELIIDPQVHFKYALFEWVGPPQGLMPYVFVWSLAVVAVMVLLGWRTRWTALLMAAGYVYWFLIDAAYYSDHRYLVCLLTVLVAWLPTNRWASVDAYMGREKRTLVPGWTIELVRLQVALVYLFFGLSLLNADWLVGSPLIAWSETLENRPAATILAGRSGLAIALCRVLPVLTLIAGPALYWKRTRGITLVVLTLFHVWDWFAFRLSVSPWLLTGLSLTYCDPKRWRNWGEVVVARLSRWSIGLPVWKGICKAGGMIDACVSWFDDTPLMGDAKTATKSPSEPLKRNGKGAPSREAQSLREVGCDVLFPTAARWGVTAWLILQCLLPVRYFIFDKNPDWTDLATMFAWRGQHRDKQCEVKMSVVQPSQELRWPLEPTEETPVPLALFHGEGELEKLGLSEGALKDLVVGAAETREARLKGFGLPDKVVERIFATHRDSLQLRLSDRQYEQLVQRPEFVRQYAQRIGTVLSRMLNEDVQVHAELQVSLNNRANQRMLSDAVELDLMGVDMNKIGDKLESLRTALPPVGDQIAAARGRAARRREDLDQQDNLASAKKQPSSGEPAKLPPLSDEDERWFQQRYVKRK